MTPGRRTAHRELTDFLAFALAIVFLVRTFVGEPFGVPTGSMAPTLLGAHKLVHCPECGKTFPVGADEPEHPPVLCRCPACETTLDIADAPLKPGNRIIVLKGPPTPLERWDVAVFKFPDEPQKFYVKRIVGLPGERLRIKAGEIELWDEEKQTWTIARKPAELAKQMAIPVWEEQLQTSHQREVWSARPANAWSRTAGNWVSNGRGELAFRHLSPAGHPILIGDELAYNSGLSATQAGNAEMYWGKADNPVRELSIEFVVQSIESSGVRLDVHFRHGSHVLELRVGHPDWGVYLDGKLLQASAPFELANGFHVCFSCIDRRLLVWRNKQLVIDRALLDEWPDEPTLDELEPIRIGASDTRVRITNLRVSRDVYYTQQAGATDFLATDAGREMMGDVKEFKRFRDARHRTREFVIPQGCYFALGDNSTRSLDGRHWKTGPFVPERLIVGRVLFKFGR